MSSFASSAMSQTESAASGSSQASLKPSSPTGAKRLPGRAAVGAALMVSCLHAGAASALSFNFSFSGIGTPSSPTTVTGIVDGLVDNVDNQTSGLTFTITSATNTPALGWSTFNFYGSGDGIDVSGGQVTGVDLQYFNFFDDGQNLYLENLGEFTELSDLNYSFVNADTDLPSSSSLIFTPVSPASVPGPLPLFGAGAAFGWSRRLRRRIKSPA